MAMLDLRAGARSEGTILAIVEIQDFSRTKPTFAQPAERGAVPVIDDVNRAVGPLLTTGESYCWQDDRLLICLKRNALAVRKDLRAIADAIARIDVSLNGRRHLTPAIGYVALSAGQNAQALVDKAEWALACAKTSLEIEPFRYVQAADPATTRRRIVRSLGLWRRVPPMLGLLVQLMISVILGFGAPFILYAICDALGSDISGPVYIGVVVVLLITALTIWIEGILAFRATEPPARFGAPAPIASVIIPAYLPNEAATILETVDAFLALDYPNTVQIIIAYNSPFDRMAVEDELEIIAARHAGDERFDIEPFRVLGSTSKAQNVNAAVGRVRGEFVGIFDADHHPKPDGLERAWRWLSNGWDIVQGRCSIRNGHESWIARMVAVEFEQIYAVSHPGRARLHGFGIFGGSNGFWRTAVLHETRMRRAMLTEDIDSSIRAVERGYRIAGDRDLISEELAPTTLPQLLNQRLRWAQGWFQVSLRRIVPALLSRHVSPRQKLGLLHLLVWRELFPWYSIQVVPIMIYWVWIYGWEHIHWTIPIFVATTLVTMSTGPAMVLFAYLLARPSMRERPGWFLSYLLVSTFFYAPFKDTLSRIAHLKEAMRERAWRVTPRRSAPPRLTGKLAVTSAALLLLAVGTSVPARSDAQPLGLAVASDSAASRMALLIGGEASTINEARKAARGGRNAQAAALFAKAIEAVPSRRGELLPEYADALLYSQRSAAAAVLYREILASRDVVPNAVPSLLRRLATALTWSGQANAALVVYDRLLASTPDDTDSALRRARVLLTLHRPQGAIAALDRIPASSWASGPLGQQGDELLVEAARAEAQAGHREDATRLIERARRHNPMLQVAGLRPSVDYVASTPPRRPSADCAGCSGPSLLNAADQLARSNPREAAAIYRAALAKLPRATPAHLKAQQGLAEALTNAGQSAQALDAWTAYLAMAPRNLVATVKRARLLSALNQDEAALRAYNQALAISPGNPDALRGAVDATVALARAAAQRDENKQSASLFAAAIALDGSRRGNWLREYADQLSFSGRPGDAIPLYREAMADPNRAAQSRQEIMIGLANAYDWAGRLDDAVMVSVELERADPDDRDLRWHRVVLAARQAARKDENAQSAALFAQALTLKPDSAATVRRQYADQLTYTGRLKEAVPIYRAVLNDPALSPTDRLEANRGLARAYGWSGQWAEAIAVHHQLVDQNPADPARRWDLLVAEARQAAHADRNAAAADFFAQAIKLQPARSGEIVRDYADQLSFTGRPANAVVLYRRLLQDPALSPSDRAATEQRLAQALDWGGRYGEAKAVYGELLQRDPESRSLKRSLLIVTARDAANADRNEQAAGYLASAIGLDPNGRFEILGEYADKLTFAHRIKEALPLYRELIAHDRLPADIREHELGLARALAWNGQPMAAYAEYQRLVALNPADTEAAIGMARMLSWAGRQDKAVIAYHAVLDRHQGEPAAMRGLAQAEDWQGHHRLAQSILSRRLSDEPGDLEARRLMAQSKIWSGRPDQAAAALKVALAAPPSPPGQSTPRASRPAELAARDHPQAMSPSDRGGSQ